MTLEMHPYCCQCVSGNHSRMPPNSSILQSSSSPSAIVETGFASWNSTPFSWHCCYYLQVLLHMHKILDSGHNWKKKPWNDAEGTPHDMYQVAHPHLCCLTSFQCYLSRHGRDHTRTRLTHIPGQVGILKVWTPISITQKELRKWIGGFQNISADTTFVISLLLISNGLTSYVTSPHLISSVFRILDLSPLHQFTKYAFISPHLIVSHPIASHLIS